MSSEKDVLHGNIVLGRHLDVGNGSFSCGYISSPFTKIHEIQNEKVAKVVQGLHLHCSNITIHLDSWGKDKQIGWSCDCE